MSDSPPLGLLGRTQPHSSESEESVLAGIFLDGVVALTQVMDGHIKPESFFIPRNRLIYQTFLWMHKNGLDLGLDVMVVELSKLGKLEDVGGVPALASISKRIPTIPQLSYYIERVREAYVQREIIKTSSITCELAYSEEAKVEEFTFEINKILSIRNATQTMKTLPMAAQDTLSLIDRIKSGAATAEDLGLTWAWPAFDEKFGQKIPGQLIALGARPGIGKSSLLRQDALHVSKKYGHTAIFSREMPVGELPPLFAQQMCGHSWKGLLKGKLHNRDIDDFYRAVQAVRAMRNLHIYDRDRTLSQLAARIKSAAQVLDLKYLGVDYLQRYDPQPERGETRDVALGRITGFLKDLAMDLKIPVLLLCQINREVEKLNREPVISDLRESGNIEQDADRVILLHAPRTDKITGIDQDINDETMNNLYVEAIQAKGRGDGRARCDMYLHLCTTTFRAAQRGARTNTGQGNLPSVD